jgi:hypothetical protein
MSSKKCRELQKQYISNGRLKNYNDYREYLENIKLSKDFYIHLSIIEISFRNSLNQFLIDKNWLTRNDILQLDAQRNIQNSIQILHQQKKQVNNDNLIAELNFGFGVRLFTKAYCSYLRYNDLKQIFPNILSSKDKKINRHYIFTKLNHIRLFRNKVFHHDKIISKIEYQNMIDEILSYFNDEIVKITKDLNT